MNNAPPDPHKHSSMGFIRISYQSIATSATIGYINAKRPVMNIPTPPPATPPTVSGKDHFGFLQGLLTQDLMQLPGHLCP